MVLSVVANILWAIVSVYIVLCLARVWLTWVPSVHSGRAGELLETVVDPYLALFRGIKAFRGKRFDFSPVVGISLLFVLWQALATIKATGSVSVGILLAIIVGSIWSFAGFILNFLAVCVLLRIIAYAARWNSLSPFWQVVDSLINPVLHAISRVFHRGRIVNYLQALVTGFILLVLASAGGGALVGIATTMLEHLPF